MLSTVAKAGLIPMNTATATASTGIRVRVFVDYWNFVLSVRSENSAFKIDWSKLGPVLTAEAGRLVDPSVPVRYEAMHVFGSYDPSKPQDAKFKHWYLSTLDRMPGVHCVLLERQRKRGFLKCPHCQVEARVCQSCAGDLRGTEEKGVDTRIATEMVSLAWANGYDVAVLVSSDRDFVPVAEFLQTKTIKVIHGSFPPNGRNLSQKSWAAMPIPMLMPQFQRP